LIAIIDDDESIQDSLSDLIESWGFEAQCFGSAKAFLESDLHGRAGCLIVDIRMPKMSGLELQARLKQQECNVPIIFITAFDDAEIPDTFGLHDDLKWIDAVDDDLVRPHIDGFVVMIANATHEGSFRDKNWTVEQYFGPFIDIGSADLFQHLRHLPETIMADVVHTLYREASLGAVVHPEPIMAGSIELNEVMLCPIAAAQIGWNPGQSDARTFVDEKGELSAYTLHWRDGGISASDMDASIRREGYAVLVREDHFEQLVHHLAERYEVRAWRHFQASSHDEVITRTATRTEDPPVSKLAQQTNS
jgi:CheY-like chemotaxis protein